MEKRSLTYCSLKRGPDIEGALKRRGESEHLSSHK